MIAFDPGALGRLLSARAVGVWSIRGDHLHQEGFWPAPDLPAEVASEFAAATARVPLTETGLAIVAVALERMPRVSVAALLPADSGSGLWLRRFGAARSFAMPIYEDGGAVGVVSAALADPERDPADVFLAILGAIAAGGSA